MAGGLLSLFRRPAFLPVAASPFFPLADGSYTPGRGHGSAGPSSHGADTTRAERRAQRDTDPSNRGQQKGGSTPPPAPKHRKSEARRVIFRELINIAADQGASITVGISTGDALQECLDRAVAYMRFAASKVDSLLVDASDADADQEVGDGFFVYRPNPQGPAIVEPNRWYLMEREARLEVQKLAGMMTQLGIAERVVQVEEAKAALLVAAVREAAIEAGLSHDQVKLLGAALRNKVEGGLGQAKAGQGGPGWEKARRDVTAVIEEQSNTVPFESEDKVM